MNKFKGYGNNTPYSILIRLGVFYIMLGRKGTQPSNDVETVMASHLFKSLALLLWKYISTMQ